jgi:hypothetical protein
MKNNNFLMWSIFVFVGIVLILIPLISAEMLVSDAGVQYEQKIFNFFNNQTLVQQEISNPLRPQGGSLEIVDNETYVRVIINLKNVSDIDNLLSDLPQDKFKNLINRNLSYNSYPKISVEITKEIFDSLIQDNRIDKIYYDEQAYLQKNNFNFNTFFICSYITNFNYLLCN